jgi:hypothetical protein
MSFEAVGRFLGRWWKIGTRGTFEGRYKEVI